MARNRRNKKLKKKIYIFCEGETEANYFDMLSKKYKESYRIKVYAKSTGQTSLQLVNYAIQSYNNMSKKQKDEVDKIYVVFDKDQVEANEIKKAFTRAKGRNIDIGFSNSSFELWLLMHFKDVNTFMNQSDLEKELEAKLNISNYHDSKGKIKLVNYFEDQIYLAMENGNKFDNNFQNNITKNPYTNLKYIINDIYGQSNY